MRYLFLILLVVIFPGGVFWALNGMAGPGDTLTVFTGQLADIRRSQPETVEEEEIGDPPEREPKPEPEPDRDPIAIPRSSPRLGCRPKKTRSPRDVRPTHCSSRDASARRPRPTA